jgi:anthranilate synthase/aminodeoxychorismate synthase-like glutamine amidotransferase
MHLLIDNYDSFTYNVVQLLGELGAPVLVRRNDRITLAEARDLAPLSLIVSPGPGVPDDAGVSMELIRHFAGRIPVLGICLGHQCLVQAFGGVIGRAPQVMHGKASWIRHDGRTIYEGLPNPFAAGRYHSLAADEDSLPAELEVSARTWDSRIDGHIMGVRLKGTAAEGVQFHPESILTVEGRRLLGNFLRRTDPAQAGRGQQSAAPRG